MRDGRITLRLSLVWVGIFALLNWLKWWTGPSTNHLFTLTDTLIAAVPIFVWLVVSIPWDKISVGPLTFERRMRRRIEDQLDPNSIELTRPVELEKSEVGKIRRTETKAVKVHSCPN